MNKKIWLLILSLCLVVFCTATAMAVEPDECNHNWQPCPDTVDITSHYCLGCGMTEKHTPGVTCQKCNKPCQHIYRENGKCTSCGDCLHSKYVFDATLNNGVGDYKCAACGALCAHAETNKQTIQQGTCTVPNTIRLTCKKCGKFVGYDTTTYNHTYQDNFLVEATCTSDAKRGTFCVKCKAQKPGTAVAYVANTMIDHVYVADQSYRDPSTGKVIYVAPTCDTKGYGYMVCKFCKTPQPGTNPTAIGKLNHPTLDYTKKTHVDASCANPEGYAYPCTLCGKLSGFFKLDGGVPQKPHTKVNKQVAATCVANGYDVDYCTTCKSEIGNRNTHWDEVPNGVHDIQVIAVLREGSCTSKSIKKVSCKRDGCTYKDQYVVSADVVHTWKNNSDYVAATCGSDAKGTKTCQVCGLIKPVDGKATNLHTYAENVTVPATCTHVSVTGKFCTGCFKPFTTVNYDAEGKPTTPGYAAVEGTKLANHKFVIAWVDKAPTCAAAGTAHVYRCETCDQFNNDGTNPVVAVLPATGNHNYVTGTVAATCTSPAKYGTICTVCGNDAPNTTSKVIDGSKPLGHDVHVNTYGPTCVTPSKIEKKCAVCGVEFEVTAEDISKAGYEFKPADNTSHAYRQTAVLRAATCTEYGIEKVKCSIEGCNSEIYRVINPGHTLDKASEVVTKAPTCGAAGKATYTCSVCHKTFEKDLNATGKHNFVAETVKPATCKSNASIGTYCTVCWYNRNSDAQEIAGTKLKHDLKIDVNFKDGSGNTIYVAPTCETAGIGYQYCTKCDKKGVVVLPANGHKFGKDIINAEETAIYHVCEVCGKRELVQAFGDVDINDKCNLFGHSESVIPAVPATCTEAGKTAGVKCTVCDKILVAQEEVKALGHKYVEGVCSVCEAKDPEYVPHVHKLTKKYSFNADFTKRVVTTTCECGYKTVEEEDF